MYYITITKFTGEVVNEPYGEENRCDNCGKPISQAKSIITGGMIADEEWACCHECSDEMVEKGCMSLIVSWVNIYIVHVKKR